VYLLVFHAYINEMHGSRSKIPSKKSRPYIYIKFLALLGAPYIYIYDISRLRVNYLQAFCPNHNTVLSESRCALRLRYVDLVVSIEFAVELRCCFTGMQLYSG
jgi:hypothetical protein